MPIPETLDLTAPPRRGRDHLYRKRPLWSLPLGQPPLPLELISKKCRILLTMGRYQAVKDILSDLVSQAEAAEEKHWSAKMSADLAYVLMLLGQAPSALVYAERAKDFFIELQDEVGLARALYGLSLIYADLGMINPAREITKDLLALSEKTGQDDLSVKAIFILRYELGPEQTSDRLQQYLIKARLSGDKALMNLCLFYLGDIYLNTGRWAEAEICNKEQYDLALEMGNRMGISYAIGDRGLIYYGQGHYREAIECYLEKLKISESMGDFYNVYEALDNAGVAHEELGELDQALKFYQRAEDHARRHQVWYYLSKSLLLKSRCLLLLGDLRRPALALAEALDIARRIGNRALEIQAELLEARLVASEEPSRAKAMFEIVLERTEDEEVRAEAYSELFRLTGDPKHKAQALENYRKYYEQTKLFYIGRRIAELERQ